MTIKNLERKLTKVEEEIRWMKKKIAKLELVAKDIRAEIKVKTSPALTVVSSIKKSKRSNAMLVEKKFIENLSSTPKRRRSSRLSITYPDVSDIPKEPNSTIENNFRDVCQFAINCAFANIQMLFFVFIAIGTIGWSKSKEAA